MYSRDTFGTSSSSNSSSSTSTAANAPNQPQQPSSQASPWSVRAEFTIHRADAAGSPVAATTRSASIVPTTGSSGVLMTYSFTPSPTYACQPGGWCAPGPSPPGYGFRRGNLVFTSTPPARRPLHQLPVRSHTIPRTGHSQPSDSGYASEQPQSSSLPSSRQPSSERRCKSTYSIVLSTGSQRLLAQAYPRPWSSYQQQQQLASTPCCRFSAVPEVCEDCAEAGARPHATHFCTRLHERQASSKIPATTTTTTTAAASRDVASQTTDIESQESPLLQRRKIRRKAQSTTTPPGSTARDELRDTNIGRTSKLGGARGVRSPTPGPERSATDDTTTSSNASTTRKNTRDNEQNDQDDNEEDNDEEEEDGSDKPKRTVHIDVYCTGSDDEDDEVEEEDDDESSTSSTEEEGLSNAASPSTVFEADDVRITHSQARAGTLPRGFQDERAFLKRASERRCASFRRAPMRMPSLASSKGYESDELLSSLYPSQFSSYSRLRDFESPAAWSAASSSAGLGPADEDSASATSWKDTASELDSLRASKASIATTGCDSLEHADSLERVRRLDGWLRPKSWRSPHLERRSLLQSRSLQPDRLNPAVKPDVWSSRSSLDDDEDEDDSDEEVGWSFVSSEGSASVVQGKLVLPATTGNNVPTNAPSNPVSEPTTDGEGPGRVVRPAGHFRERIGPFGSASPSPPPSRIESRVTSPFTTPQGERTDHIIKASIFGRVVSTFRKPGHHIGPAKNPACSCEHCRRHFEEVAAARARSRSIDVNERRNGSRASSVVN